MSKVTKDMCVWNMYVHVCRQEMCLGLCWVTELGVFASSPAVTDESVKKEGETHQVSCHLVAALSLHRRSSNEALKDGNVSVLRVDYGVYCFVFSHLVLAFQFKYHQSYNPILNAICVR